MQPMTPQQSFDFRQVTIAVIGLMFVGGGLVDVLLDKFGSNKATISRVWIALCGKHPILIAEMAYALVLFYLHLTYGVLREPSASSWLRITKALVALLPVFHMVLIIFLAKPCEEDAIEAMLLKERGTMVLYTLAGVLLAIPAWYYCVPQHLLED